MPRLYVLRRRCGLGPGMREAGFGTRPGVGMMRLDVDADGTVRLDGVAVGRAKTHALDGRPLAAIEPGTIPPEHYYLFTDHADSRDSRYAEIGLVPRTRILGLAIAMPDIPRPGLSGPLVGPEDAAPAAILPHPAEGAPPHDRNDLEAGGNDRPEAAR